MSTSINGCKYTNLKELNKLKNNYFNELIPDCPAFKKLSKADQKNIIWVINFIKEQVLIEALQIQITSELIIIKLNAQRNNFTDPKHLKNTLEQTANYLKFFADIYHSAQLIDEPKNKNIYLIVRFYKTTPNNVHRSGGILK